MLAKMCRRLCVPRPGRGYRAKIAAGYEQERPPLPPLAAGAHHEIIVIYLSASEGSSASRPVEMPCLSWLDIRTKISTFLM